MNKIIKYGVVAGLTMTAFSLATTPATYASTVEPVTCAEASALADGATVEIALADTTCTIKVNFNAAFFKAETIMGKYNAAKATFNGANIANIPGTSYFSLSVEDTEATLTINANALSIIRNALKSGNVVSVDIANNTNDSEIAAESYKIYFTAETVQPVLSVAINGAEATTIANSGAIVDLKEDTTAVAVSAQFPTALNTAGIGGNQATLSGFKSEVGVNKYSVAKSGNVVTFTLTTAGIQEVLDSEDGVTLTIKDSADDVVFTVTLKKKTIVALESVAATIDSGDKIATAYNEGYEGTPTLGYAVEDGYKDIVTVAADGTISVADTYKTATAKDVVITVTATDGEIVKTTTVTYTIAANYTAVEASFENGEDEDTIKVSGTTKLVMPEVDGVTYTWEANYPITIAEDGTISVVEGHLSYVDEGVAIVVKGFVGEGEDAVELDSKTLILTVEKNRSYEEKPAYDVVEGDGQKVAQGTKKELVFKIDAPYDQFKYLSLYNKTLNEYLESIDMSGMTSEEREALLTEEQWESVWMLLTKDEDYTVKEGSTVITLSDALVAKLVAGEYGLLAHYRDDADIDNIVDKHAEATFTIAAAAPDTGAATAVKAGATSSVLASVLAAITAAGAAVVAKFAKRK